MLISSSNYASCERSSLNKFEHFTQGHVVTHHGIVSVYAQPNNPRIKRHNTAFTDIMFVYNGREYSRRYKKHYSNRYITTLAKRLAHDVVIGVFSTNENDGKHS